MDGHQVSAVIAARGVGEAGLGDLDEVREVMDVCLCVQRRVFVRSRFLRRVVKAVDHCRPDTLILNNALWAQAALPHLDPSIRRVVVVHGHAKEEIELAGENPQYWDALVAVGPGLHQRLVELWGPERVNLIPVGVAEPRRPPVHDYSADRLRICYVGRVSQPQKNVFLIPAVARGLAGRGVEFRWTVVGDGPDLPALKAQAAEAAVSEFFDYAGWCPGSQVESILAQQHVLVLPSNSESIGHALLEAQILGVVPVASRLAGATDFVIQEGRNGLLCEPGDPGGFVDAVATLSGDRAKLERLSRTAQKDTRDRHTISAAAARYYRLIRSLPRAAREMQRKAATAGYYPIPRTLLPSRLSTTMSFGKRLIHHLRKTTAGRRATLGSR